MKINKSVALTCWFKKETSDLDFFFFFESIAIKTTLPLS